MKENSIEEDIEYEKIFKIELSNEEAKEILKSTLNITEIRGAELYVVKQAIKQILKENEELLELKVSASAHNRILELEKENEELTISNKEIDKECSRLEEKEVKLINENEHYKDLIYALETYYNITEEDLEECMKNDR